ncbi:hypothetical protein HYX05_01595 [Candidatus Woesearchaeota archaeon]|nr:hypothetical protein [Candidatus Woesearchaeota archaeon]
MRKIIIVMLFVILMQIVYGQPSAGCGPTPAPASCLDSLACGAKECVAVYEPLDAAASGTCNSAVAKIMAEYAECLAKCEENFGITCGACETKKEAGLEATFSAYKAAVTTNKELAVATQTGIVKGGSFFLKLIPCSEMINCFMQTPSFIQTAEGLKMARNCLSLQAIKFFLGQVGNIAYEKIDKDADPTEPKTAQAMVEENYQTHSTTVAAGVINTCANNCDKAALTNFVKAQDSAILADPSVRSAMVNAQVNNEEKALEVSKVVMSNNQNYQSAQTMPANAKESLENDPNQAQSQYFAENAQAAKSELDSEAAKAAGQVTTNQVVWTNCPGHRDGACSGQPNCIQDLKDGASQCLTVLPPSSQVDIGFSSLHVIDKKQSSMFTLKGTENEGVVYQQDGFVNIDKGGTTKISVAGQGVSATDANSNQLYIGRGTTTYLGTGSESPETYLTNTFIFNPKSSVAVAAVNQQEQQKLRESRAININRDEKLSLTFDKQKLSLYMNAVDISGFAVNYLILTRGFSNIKLVERDKSFPLASRNNAKGDSLIVKNKDVAISKGYNVNDGTYNYIIKTAGSSTKVFAENGKTIEDSSPMSSEVSPRQQILLYKDAFT